MTNCLLMSSRASVPVFALPFVLILLTITMTGAPVIPDSHTVILDHFNLSTVGSVHGAPGYGPGPAGMQQAVGLGGGEYVQYGLISALETQGTIEMWVNPASDTVGLMNFNWGNTTSYPPAGHVLHLGTNAGKLSIGGWAWNPANMYSLTSAATVPVGEWSHIALSWSALGAKLYVNGAVSASSNLPWHPASPQWGYLNYWGDVPLGGVDELHISDIQRTDAEIGAHASLNAVPEPGTWGLFSLGLMGVVCARRRFGRAV